MAGSGVWGPEQKIKKRYLSHWDSILTATCPLVMDAVVMRVVNSWLYNVRMHFLLYVDVCVCSC